MRFQEERPPDRLAFAMLVAFAVLMYAIPGEWIDGLADLRLALMASAAAAGLMLLRRLFKFEPVFVDGIRGCALIGVGTIALASASWSVFPEASLSTSAELFKAVAIYLTMINVVTTPRRLKILCAALVLGSMVTSIGAINWHRAGVNLVEGFRTRWLGVFADPNYLAMNVGVIVPVAIAFISRRESSWLWRMACALAVGLAVVTIVLTHSRGGFLGLVAAMAIWAVREKRRIQAIMVSAALALGLFVFAPETFWKRNETIGEFREDASALGRIHAWEAAANMNSAHPLLGVGAGTFVYAWPIYRPAEEATSHVAHNLFLDVVSELGFVGLLLFLIFLGGATGGAFRSTRKPDLAWLTRAIAASMVAYLTSSLFLSGYTLSAHLYVLCGLAACADRITRRRPHAAAERVPRPIVPPPDALAVGVVR